MTTVVAWPPEPPPWLEPWVIWRFRGQTGTRPKTPLPIPPLGWCVLAWCAWRRAGGLPDRRPPCAPTRVRSWGWALLRAVNRAVPVPSAAPPPTPTSTRTRYPSPVILQPSVWIATLVNAPPGALGPYMEGAGIRLAFAQTVNGMLRTGGVETWADGMRSRGLLPGGWSWTTCENVEVEAAAIVDSIRTAGLVAYCINGEKQAEQSGRSGDLVLAVRRAVGSDFPLGWSPEPQLALAHDVFRANGVAYMQQAYPGGGGNGYDLAGCMEVAKAQGYDPARDCLPLVQAYDPRPSADLFAVQARQYGLRGTCVYPAEQAYGVAPGWWAAAQP